MHFYLFERQSREGENQSSLSPRPSQSFQVGAREGPEHKYHSSLLSQMQSKEQDRKYSREDAQHATQAIA